MAKTLAPCRERLKSDMQQRKNKIMSTSTIQMNGLTVVSENGRIFVNGKELDQSGSELRTSNLISVGFIAGGLAGLFSGSFLTLMYLGLL